MTSDRTKKFIAGAFKAAANEAYKYKTPFLIKAIVSFINGGIENSEEDIVKEINELKSNPVLPIYITGALIPLSDDVDLISLEKIIDDYKKNSKNYIRNITVLDESKPYINDISCHKIGETKYLIFDLWDKDGEDISLFKFRSSYLDAIPEYYEIIMEMYMESTGASVSIMNEMYIF